MSDMYRRCDDNTARIMDTAAAESGRLAHNWVGTEHVLVALAHHRTVLPEAVAALLPSESDLRAALQAELGDQPTSDAELLATLGIDLDQVRVAVRDSFGTDAVERLGQRSVHQPWQPWRRPTRRCLSLLAGHRIVTPRLKQALEHALGDSQRRDLTRIDPAGLLLGLVEVEDGLANQLLRDMGTSPADVRAALH